MTSSFTCMLSNLADPYPSTQTALQGQEMSHHNNIWSSDAKFMEQKTVQLLFACEIIQCWPNEASIEEHRSATDDYLMSSLAVTDSYNQITAC